MSTPNPFLSPNANASNTQVNTISLVSAEASKITKVSLYSGRAEITRLFKLALVKGQNQVIIRGFPHALQHNFVRVEGRGNASIHDVIISINSPSSNMQSKNTESSPDPERKQEELENQIAHAEHARTTLDVYMDSYNANNVAFSELDNRLTSHALLARKLDNDILDLKQELADLVENSNAKKEKSILLKAEAKHLPWQIAIDVWAQANEKEAAIWVIYVVNNADWRAKYDIRADMQSSSKNITIHYKASMGQDTGESWEGVPLILETVAPAFDIVSPSVFPWIVAAKTKSEYTVQPYTPLPVQSMSGDTPIPPTMVTFPPSSGEPLSQPYDLQTSTMPQGTMQHRPGIVTTGKGNITATFRIPGYINVPSDSQQHNVTIASFEFKAPLLWYTVPQASAHVYMEAKIKNESNYAFIPGSANLYIDGSFVATTSIPAVSPQETFSCPLGIDSSLRVTYHPQEVNNNTTGFYKKSRTETHTQRISIVNTKSIAIENLKVVDLIPLSQDERIEIKLLNPPLPSTAGQPSGLQRMMSLASSEKDNYSKKSKGNKIRVSPGVVALWDGTGDPKMDQDVVGKNGRVRWDVSLRPQETANLVMKFEVSYPEKLSVVDMY